jgi:hypothetical protein
MRVRRGVLKLKLLNLKLQSKDALAIVRLTLLGALATGQQWRSIESSSSTLLHSTPLMSCKKLTTLLSVSVLWTGCVLTAALCGGMKSA